MLNAYDLANSPELRRLNRALAAQADDAGRPRSAPHPAAALTAERQLAALAAVGAGDAP